MSKIVATSTSEFIVTISHLLGFTPTESIVVVSLTSGMHARVDFPRSVNDVMEVTDALAQGYRNDPGPLWLFAFTANAPAAPLVLGVLPAAFVGVRIEAMFHVNGDHWSDVSTGETIESGTITTADRDYIAAQAVMAGKAMPQTDRAAHVDQFARTAPIDVDTVTHVLEEVLTETAEEISTGTDAILDTARATGLALTDTETARLIGIAAVPTYREQITVTTTRETGPADLAVWTHVATHTPEGTDRTGALHLTAFAAWMTGDGALAYAALDTAHDEGAEMDRVAAIVIHALRNGINPTTWQTGEDPGE